MGWLSSTFIGKCILTMLMSMVPVIELRGAIPFGVGLGLRIRQAMMVSFIGNLIPTPFIIIFIERIFAWMRKLNPKLDKLVTKLEARGANKSEAVRKYGFIGLAILVAIPLPGTGAWTGALVAGLLNIPLKKSMLAEVLGVFAAAWIVGILTYGVASFI